MSEMHVNAARKSNTYDVMLTCGHNFKNQLPSFYSIRMAALWGDFRHQPHPQTLPVSYFKHKSSVLYIVTRIILLASLHQQLMYDCTWLVKVMPINWLKQPDKPDQTVDSWSGTLYWQQLLPPLINSSDGLSASFGVLNYVSNNYKTQPECAGDGEIPSAALLLGLYMHIKL